MLRSQSPTLLRAAARASTSSTPYQPQPVEVCADPGAGLGSRFGLRQKWRKGPRSVLWGA